MSTVIEKLKGKCKKSNWYLVQYTKIKMNHRLKCKTTNYYTKIAESICDELGKDFLGMLPKVSILKK